MNKEIKSIEIQLKKIEKIISTRNSLKLRNKKDWKRTEVGAIWEIKTKDINQLLNSLKSAISSYRFFEVLDHVQN